MKFSTLNENLIFPFGDRSCFAMATDHVFLNCFCYFLTHLAFEAFLNVFFFGVKYLRVKDNGTECQECRQYREN